jgi:hypothetical protein
MQRFFFRAALPAFVLAFVAACGGDTPATTEVTVQGPVSFVIVSGDNQTGAAGEELPQPVVVRAQDASGNPIAGRHVGFAVVQGAGEMFVGGGVTDANGIVKDYWTLGRVAADSQRIEARSVDPATGAKQVFGVFRATSVPGAAVMTVPLTTPPPFVGWDQPVRSLILDSVRVAVADRFGNRVMQAGIPVQWIPSHGGNITATSGIINTNAQGVASTQWRLGTLAGPQTLSTSVGGAAPKVTYNATGRPGAPAHVQFALDSIHVSAFGALPVTVTSTDAYGNTVPHTFVALDSILGVGPTGVPAAVRNGKGRLVAVAGTRADTSVVTVQQVAAVIQYRTMPATMKVGATLPIYWYTVIRDANGSVIANPTNVWTSSNPAVASVNSTGTVTAHTTGSFTITVSRDGVTRALPAVTVVP